jgi:hypothetical protein
MLGVVDTNKCTRANLDLLFVSSNMSGPKLEGNPKRALCRFQFIEYIVACAQLKFDSLAPSAALLKFLNDFIPGSGAGFADQDEHPSTSTGGKMKGIGPRSLFDVQRPNSSGTGSFSLSDDEGAVGALKVDDPVRFQKKWLHCQDCDMVLTEVY